MRKMGTFRVGCKIVNIADPKKSAEVEKLLVDTGSDYMWLPAKTLESIGVFAETADQLLLGARTLKGFNARVDSKHKKLVAAGPVLAAGNVKQTNERIGT